MAIEKGRKPNTWHITFNLPEKDENGKYKRAPKRTVHGLKSDAKRELARYRLEYTGESDEGEDGMNLTVADYADKFHSQHVMKSPLAYDREKLEVRYIRRLFGNVRIDELTPQMIRDVYEKERSRRNLPLGKEEPNPLSEDGLYKVHVKLRQILSQAYNDDLIPANPCGKVKFPKPSQRNERKSLTLGDARRFREQLLRNFELDGDPKLIALLIIIGTGCRRGEALGLSWRDIDFENGTISLVNQYAKDKDLRNPKMDSRGHVVGMDAALAETLASWREIQCEGLEQVNRRRAAHGKRPLEQNEGMPVVTGKYGQRVDPDVLGKFFRNYCVDNGWGKFTKDVVTKEYGGRTFTRGKGYEGLTMHELRHTVASLLIAEGLDVKTVQHQLGHESAQTTLNVYAHAFESRSREAADTLGRILS